MTGVGSTLGGETVAQLQDGDDTYTAVLRAMGITVQESLERGASWPEAMAAALGTGEAHGFELCGPDKVPVSSAWMHELGEAFASGSVHMPARVWNAR
jgi:hypothetical protein